MRFSGAYQGDLGSPVQIDRPYAGAGAEILQHQHQAAARWAGQALPFGERSPPYLSGDGLRKGQIAFGVLVAQAGCADAERARR